jgi:hypothetical protein
MVVEAEYTLITSLLPVCVYVTFEVVPPVGICISFNACAISGMLVRKTETTRKKAS